MKKYMLLVIIGVSLSSCAAASCDTGTNKGVTIIDDDNVESFAPYHASDFVVKAYEPAPFADLSEILYLGYVPKAKPTEVKLGSLKNKVNIFHLFYRNKI